jgi:hypothetical protein
LGVEDSVRRSGGEDSEKWGAGGEGESRALGDRFGGTMTMNNERKVIELEQGWAFMQKGITKLKNLLEGVPEQQFNSEEYIMLYTYFCFSLSLSLSLSVSRFFWRKVLLLWPVLIHANFPFVLYFSLCVVVGRGDRVAREIPGDKRDR